MSARPILFWPYQKEDVQVDLGYGAELFTIIGTGGMRDRTQTKLLESFRDTTAYDPHNSMGGIYGAVARVHKLRVISGKMDCLAHLKGMHWRGVK